MRVTQNLKLHDSELQKKKRYALVIFHFLKKIYYNHQDEKIWQGFAHVCVWERKRENCERFTDSAPVDISPMRMKLTVYIWATENAWRNVLDSPQSPINSSSFQHWHANAAPHDLEWNGTLDLRRVRSPEFPLICRTKPLATATLSRFKYNRLCKYSAWLITRECTESLRALSFINSTQVSSHTRIQIISEWSFTHKRKRFYPDGRGLFPDDSAHTYIARGITELFKIRLWLLPSICSSVSSFC